MLEMFVYLYCNADIVVQRVALNAEYPLGEHAVEHRRGQSSSPDRKDHTEVRYSCVPILEIECQGYEKKEANLSSDRQEEVEVWQNQIKLASSKSSAS